MNKVPAEITWTGLKRIKIKKDYIGYKGVKEFRIGPKALRIVNNDGEFLRLEKTTNGYWGSREDELKIKFIDDNPEAGVSRTHLTIYLDFDQANTLAQWILDGKYIPPQSIAKRHAHSSKPGAGA